MECVEVDILITGGAFFFGVVLGRFFKVLVLVPAGTLVIVLLLVTHVGHTLLDSLLGIGLLIASLDLGYVTGLISKDIFAAVQGFRGFLERVRHPASSRN